MIAQALHIAMALLLFFGSSGVVFNKHYCGGELKSVALFVAAEACHAKKTSRTCPMHPPATEAETEKKGCCEDESELVKPYEDVDVPHFDVELVDYQPLTAVPPMGTDWLTIGSDKKTLHYLNYKPPLIVRSLFVSIGAFLL